MHFRRSVGIAVVCCLPLAAFAAPVVEAPIPSVVALPGISGAAVGGSAQAALGSFFDGTRLLRNSLSPVIAPALLSGAPAALPLGKPQVLDRTAPDSGGVAETVPGSIFEWKPAEDSPGHGFAPIDALVRRLASRKDRRFDAGFSFSNGPREQARIFLYGERHTDKELIVENMRRMAEDMRRGREARPPGQGALILDEGYMGPPLFGSQALRYLEAKGFDAAWLGPEAALAPHIEVRGWDAPEPYDRSRSLSLRYHMALYELNGLMHGDSRGFAYYAQLWRKSLELARLWRETRRAAIAERNVELDRRVAAAVLRAREEGITVHVIAGSEHLVESPLLMGVPALGAARARRGLAEALGDTPYWVAMPSTARSRPNMEEVAFAANASAELAALADDIGAERGLKSSRMTGKEFIELIEAGRIRFAAQARVKSPSPRAFVAAMAVQANVARVARALLEPGQPLSGQVSRLLSVWSVFSQEMRAAAEKGTLEAVESDARLFAEQVEASI